MKVRATGIPRDALPHDVRRYMGEGQTFTKPGKEYEVHSISVFDGVGFLQIVDDVHSPAWYPARLFEVTDGTIPDDWTCNLFPYKGLGELSIVLGPEFVASDEASYEAMVQLDPAQVDRFWKRIDARSSRSEH